MKYLCSKVKSNIIENKLGDVAQLARALDWQSRGRGFDSHLLHKKPLVIQWFFYFEERSWVPPMLWGFLTVFDWIRKPIIPSSTLAIKTQKEIFISNLIP